jgi:serine/threonine-protein kinase
MAPKTSDAEALTHGYTSQSWFGALAEPEADPLLGNVLGGSYRVVSVLGEGGMGRVYLAEHTRIAGKRYAIKMLHPEFVRHAEAVARFEREAEAAAALAHPNVVGVYDIDRAPDGRPFLVCELLEGVELGARLEQEMTLPVPVAVRIARQLCRALAAAHGRDIIHRDVKPENVFLVGDRWRPTVKILDFGLSRLERAGDATLTRAGAIMGTPAYMAPEQAHGKRVDARADIYGVGGILYRSLTGMSPFERDDPTAALGAVLTEEAPRPRSIAPEIPEALEAIIQRAMAKLPEERFRSMDELDAALSAFEAESTVTRDTVPATVGSGFPAPPPRPRAETTSSLLRITPYARPLLAVATFAALIAATALLLTAATSAIALGTGRPVADLTALEIGLVAAAIAATLMTPVLFGVRHVRRRVWENTLRVSEVLHAFTTVMLAGAAAYGVAALTVQLADGMLAPLGRDPGGGGQVQAGWPGWSLVFAAVSLLAAVTVGVLGRLRRRRVLRLFVTPLLGGAALLLGVGMLYAGFRVRAGNAVLPEIPEGVSDEGDPADASARPPSRTEVPPPATTPAPSRIPPGEPAPAAELAAATKGGGPALERLAERYPADPALMRALVDAHGARAETYPQALAWGRKLLALSPEDAKHMGLRRTVLRAAHGKDPTAATAFELMSQNMGSDGADLLFDLMVASEVSDVRSRAKDILADEALRARGTPALRVAYDLRMAKSCEGQAALLERAAADGDGRSILALSSSAVGTPKGCGPRGRQACKPKCAAESAKMRATMRTIEQRMK